MSINPPPLALAIALSQGERELHELLFQWEIKKPKKPPRPLPLPPPPRVEPTPTSLLTSLQNLPPNLSKLDSLVFLGTVVGMFTTATLFINAEILKLIAAIDEFKGAWRASGTMARGWPQQLRHVATIESIGSSTRIEGSKLSNREVEAPLSKLEIKRFDTRNEQEVAAVFLAVCACASQTA